MWFTIIIYMLNLLCLTILIKYCQCFPVNKNGVIIENTCLTSTASFKSHSVPY